MLKNSIFIKGAREHNLKNIEVEIPKNKLVVFSGVSGSGKSTLAMDTLYAEGQRRYVESLSAYARQFLGMLPRPDVDSIEGLSPAISIDQHALSHNPRSTVGTVTEIYDFLRVLFARIGHPHCPNCSREISRQTSEQILSQISSWAKKNLIQIKQKQLRIMILAPVIRDKRGEFSKLFENLKKKGFEQVRIDGQIHNLDEEIFLIKTNRHNVEVVVDKIVLGKALMENKDTLQRLKDDLEIALNLTDGLVIVSQIKDKSFSLPVRPRLMEDQVYSSRFACPVCNLSLSEIEPRIFSFNSPFGACPECNGLGMKMEVDPKRFSPWRAAELEKRYYNTTSEIIRQEIEKLMIKQPCPLCLGTRLKKEALTVTIDRLSIADVSDLVLGKIRLWLNQLPAKLSSKKEIEIANPIIVQITNRLKFLDSVGVGYLSLSRNAASLSVGEGQRIRLASQVGSGLTGILYILDEPTVGLHPRDIQKLIDTLKDLQNLGNTLVVVEHDQKVLEQADWIIDFGPAAGKAGGEIVFTGTVEELKKSRQSLTGQYLSGRKKITSDPGSRIKAEHWLTISGCKIHNLKNMKASFPLSRLVCLTGVSGSGKSSLLTDTLYPALKKKLNPEFKEPVGQYDSLSGEENLERVFLVDQSPIGRTSRSNPATYIGVFTDIRQLFSQTREAKLKGYSPTFFSFNTAGGRCEACLGQGQIRIQMQFLSDIWVECEECRGKRFKAGVLEVQFEMKNIAEVLKLTVTEARQFFESIPVIHKKLTVLETIGLGYLELGQNSPTLSGGESQRLKLARELVKQSDGKTMYILDEPTTGLHFDDLNKLLAVLRVLVARGDSVMVIEHNLDLIRQADWVIDLGPEGGEAGGRLIAQGTPDQVARVKNSWTGKYLQKFIKK